MADSKISPLDTTETVHLYSTPGAAATPALHRMIQERIKHSGPLAFSDFMAMALYEPGLGYYARGLGQTGRDGDFYTSVSVGPLFGRLLARRFLNWWKNAGSPNLWRMVEVGAHDGTLAHDILSELSVLNPTAFSAVEYRIIEPLEQLREAQMAKLAGFGATVKVTSGSDDAVKLPGVVFGNEVLDALPFQIVEKTGDHWAELKIGLNGDEQFEWRAAQIDPAFLPKILSAEIDTFPQGYRTEIRDYKGFLAPFRELIDAGLLIFPDYGYARPEYYHPDRTTGTLRTFSKHQAAENPLERPGEMDITAHVDFTTFAEQAHALRYRASAFQSQGHWLTQLARDWLLAQEGNPEVSGLRQFQSLTHPGHLGRRFQVIELAWNDATAAPLSAPDAHRLGC